LPKVTILDADAETDALADVVERALRELAEVVR
jgi:hypothetical protein